MQRTPSLDLSFLSSHTPYVLSMIS